MEVSRGANLVGMMMMTPDACPLSLLKKKKKSLVNIKVMLTSVLEHLLRKLKQESFKLVDNIIGLQYLLGFKINVSSSKNNLF